MSEKKRVLLLILVLTVIVFIATGITNILLFRHEIENQRKRLVVTAQSQARLIEAVARFDAQYSTDYPGGAYEATLSQVSEAHDNFRGFGETGEFTLARRDRDQIVFPFRQRHRHLRIPNPVPVASDLAEPMRHALQGHPGTLIGPDYRGDTVLAAYEPVGVDTGGIKSVEENQLGAFVV